MVHLIVLEGEREVKRHPLTADASVLGRSPSCDIVIEGPAVSGTHCRIEKTADGYRVLDLNSTNGTRVNNTRIESQNLRQGDMLMLGTTPLRIEGEELPPAVSEADAARTTTSLTRSQMRPRTLSDAKPVSLPKDFEKRGNSRRKWIIVIVIVIILIVLAAALYLRQMLAGA